MQTEKKIIFNIRSNIYKVLPYGQRGALAMCSQVLLSPHGSKTSLKIFTTSVHDTFENGTESCAALKINTVILEISTERDTADSNSSKTVANSSEIFQASLTTYHPSNTKTLCLMGGW
jgi:hypothetical protein